MSYQVFARKYRPRTFDDLLGQDHVVRTLRNAIDQGRLAHAYLFVGPRGTGKTSTARIFAKALNCSGGPKADFDPDEDLCLEIAEGRSLDVLEIDGASNRGIDEIRQLRETVQYLPARGRFKIYYIDEVHMLTKEAFNALLKTLEEPPPHVKFIFATTEPEKILATILSRCQRFDLRPIPPALIADHLLHIAGLEAITLDPAAAWAIARGADGGMRDAQSMLDQLVSFCGERIDEAQVLDVFGLTSRETVAGLLGSLLARDLPAALATVQQETATGRDLGRLLADLVDTLRALLVARIDPAADGEGIPPEAWQNLRAAADHCPTDRILAMIDAFAETEGRMRWATHKRLHFEIGLMKAVQTLGEARLSDVIKVIANTAATTAPTRLDPHPTAETPAAPTAETPADPPAETPAEPPAEPPADLPADPPPPRSAPSKRKPAPPRRATTGAQRLAALADQAADDEPPPPPAPAPFHPDPLVEKALDLFKGKLA